ncbi:hypothetical protein EMCRGX_G023443 [Ephydatia muelleri]
MNRVAAFGSGNRGPLTTTLTSSYPTSTEAISFTMPSTSAASSSSSGTSVPVHPSLASAPTSTSQAGNAAEVIPQHPLQPMLKSIIDELRRTYHEEVLGKVLGGDALHAQKLQKGMKFAKRKLTDIRSEERRRLFGVNPCDAFPALQTKDFAQSYSLFEPNSRTLAEYGVSLEKAILRDSELLSDVNNAFCNSHPLLAQKVVTRSARAAVSKISADALLAKAISVRRSQAGSLLKTIRKVNAKKLQESDILVGHRFHTAGAEPYFFDNSYTHRKQHGAIPVDLNGRCVVAEEIKDRDKVTMRPLKWKCTNECRKLTSEEVAIVLKTNSLFQKSIEDLRAGLDALDSGCGHVHYDVTLKSHSGFIDQLGHPIYCELPECSSPLRVIRAAMPHYPALRTFTRLLYKARKCHMTILAIDSALASGNIDELIPFMGMKDNLSDLFSEDGVEHAVVSEDHLSSGLGCIERDSHSVCDVMHE